MGDFQNIEKGFSMTLAELTRRYLQADAETKELCKIILAADAEIQEKIAPVLEEWNGGSPEELRVKIRSTIKK